MQDDIQGNMCLWKALFRYLSIFETTKIIPAHFCKLFSAFCDVLLSFI